MGYDGGNLSGFFLLVCIIGVLCWLYILIKDGYYGIKDRDWAKISGLALISSLIFLLASLGLNFNTWVVWSFRMLLYISVVFSGYHLLRGKIKSMD